MPNLPGPLKRVALGAFEVVQRLKGMPLVHLTTVGAKSGLERTVPLRVFAEGPDQWLVVASLGGAPQNPAWLHNLAAHPDQVTLRLGKDTFPVTPQTLAGAERDRAWARVVRDAPSFGAYQTSTDRVIPVVRLTRAVTSS